MARSTEYTPSPEDVRVNVKGPLDETESASVSLLMSMRLPPARPETVPPTEKAAELLELGASPQPVSCQLKRLISRKPQSFMTSWLTCALQTGSLKSKSRQPDLRAVFPTGHPIQWPYL